MSRRGGLCIDEMAAIGVDADVAGIGARVAPGTAGGTTAGAAADTTGRADASTDAATDKAEASTDAATDMAEASTDVATDKAEAADAATDKTQWSSADAAGMWQVAAEGLALPAECGVPKVVEALRLLHVAVWNDHAETVAALLQRWTPHLGPALVDANVPPHAPTLLMWAARYGSCSAAAALLQAKARLDYSYELQVPALAQAARRGHVNVMQVLVDAKADIGAIGSIRNTLSYAADGGTSTASGLPLRAKPTSTSSTPMTTRHCFSRRLKGVRTPCTCCSKRAHMWTARAGSRRFARPPSADVWTWRRRC